MSRIKTYLKKGWVFIAAAALIFASSSTMAALLNGMDPVSEAPTVIVDEPAAADAAGSDPQTPSAEKPVFNVIVQSTDYELTRKQIKEKLSYTDLSQEEIEKQTEQIIANMTPTAEDMTAEQAAQKVAAVIAKSFAIDLNGWTARANFYKYDGTPYGDLWQFDFTRPEDQDKTDHWLAADHYSASIDAITGETVFVDFFSSRGNANEDRKTDIEGTSWIQTAENYVSGLIGDDVSITGSSIVQKNEYGGVIVVCTLSDQTAYGIRMRGNSEDQQVAYAAYFTKGYDGTLDDKGGDVTEEGVG